MITPSRTCFFGQMMVVKFKDSIDVLPLMGTIILTFLSSLRSGVDTSSLLRWYK